MMDGDVAGIGFCAIAVMAKASVPGLTKTRLCPPLAPADAASLNTAFLIDIAANLQHAAEQVPIRPWMAFTPARSQAFFRDVLGDEIGLVACERPGFGDCLFHAVKSLLDLGHTSACVLNSDSPTLPTAFLVTAATILAAPGDRMVIGPSADGGYYLLGLKAPHRRVFEDIAWSTETVFQTSLARAREIGLETVVLPEWYDVDDAATLDNLVEEIVDGTDHRGPGLQRPPCHATRAVLQRLLVDGIVRRAGHPEREVA